MVAGGSLGVAACSEMVALSAHDAGAFCKWFRGLVAVVPRISPVVIASLGKDGLTVHLEGPFCKWFRGWVPVVPRSSPVVVS